MEWRQPSTSVDSQKAQVDGSDELDFDPLSGLIFGTNIINGEVIAFAPFMMEVMPPGSTHFIDGFQVAGGSSTGLCLLGSEVDGIRTDGGGHLIFTGRSGVLGSIGISGVLSDGADDSDVLGLFVDSSGFTVLDDLSPLATVPEPATLAIWSIFGSVGLAIGRLLTFAS